MRAIARAGSENNSHPVTISYTLGCPLSFATEPMNKLITHTFRNCYRLILFVFAFPLLLFPGLAYASLPQSSNVPGGVAIVPLTSILTSTGKPQAWLGDQPVLVTSDHELWFAVVGLALDITPGEHELRVNTDGESQVQHFIVNPKDYPEQRITLKDKSKVELSAADLARAEREISAITGLKQTWRAAPDNDLDFIIPVEGELSSRFGLRRYFNDEPRAPHAGLDVAVARGTPVKASAPGTVLAADDYFFNGKTIFIDHGNGLITMYCHLDKFKVQADQTVSKGQLIGLSGKTGRATGPHLHWSVVLNGVMVDPELFIP
jgi:murein DD-endopeptidase MepM/ murein hydrolase activator NlpD